MTHPGPTASNERVGATVPAALLLVVLLGCAAIDIGRRKS